MQKVRPNWIEETEAENTFVISGIAGRYISMTNGPKAESIPKTIIG